MRSLRRCRDGAAARPGVWPRPSPSRFERGVWFKVGAMCRCVARYTEGHMSNGRLQPVCCRWLLARSICRWWCWRAMMHGKREHKLKSSRSPAKQSWSVNLVPCRERPSSIGFPSQSPSLCIPRSPQPLPSTTVPKASKCIKDQVLAQDGLVELIPTVAVISRSTVAYGTTYCT